MILRFLVVLAFGVFGLVACAGSKEISDKESSGEKKFRGVGVIKTISVEDKKLTIDHGDIPGFMSAMEMEFVVREKQLIEELKVGDEVEFYVRRDGSEALIVEIKKIETSSGLAGERLGFA